MIKLSGELHSNLERVVCFLKLRTFSLVVSYDLVGLIQSNCELCTSGSCFLLTTVRINQLANLHTCILDLNYQQSVKVSWAWMSVLFELSEMLKKLYWFPPGLLMRVLRAILTSPEIRSALEALFLWCVSRNACKTAHSWVKPLISVITPLNTAKPVSPNLRFKIS